MSLSKQIGKLEKDRFEETPGGEVAVRTVSDGAGSASAAQAGGLDAAGADAYTTVVTATAARGHIKISLGGSNDAIVSLDSGTTDHIFVEADSVMVLDDILIASGATVQGKNATGAANYTNLAITIW